MTVTVCTEEAAAAAAVAVYRRGMQSFLASFESAGRGCLAQLREMLAGSVLDVSMTYFMGLQTNLLPHICKHPACKISRMS